MLQYHLLVIQNYYYIRLLVPFFSNIIYLYLHCDYNQIILIKHHKNNRDRHQIFQTRSSVTFIFSFCSTYLESKNKVIH